MEEKNCKLIFRNKKVHPFRSEDLETAIKFCEGRNDIFAIETPWCVLSIFDREEFEHIMDAVMEDHTVVPDSAMEDLV